MNKHISHQQLLPELPLLWSEPTVAASVKESPKSEEKIISRYTCSAADFKASQDIESDLMYGRGAWLYKQLERELAQERKRDKELNAIMAMRAEDYKYNF